MERDEPGAAVFIGTDAESSNRTDLGHTESIEMDERPASEASKQTPQLELKKKSWGALLDTGK